MRSIVVVIGATFLSIAAGCSNVVGIEDLPPANDDAGSTSQGGGTSGGNGSSSSGRSSSTAASSTASPPADCSGVTITTACDQCVVSSCCNELSACGNDLNCSGAVNCLSTYAGNISALCGCLQSVGGINSYGNSAYFACSNRSCSTPCGDPLALGAACSASSSCQPGPCAPDRAGTYRCLRLCCYNADCPSTQTCQTVTSIEGGSTRVCL